MNSRDLVSKTIKGESPSRTPVYGWVSANLEEQLTKEFGSVRNFEDKYEFDMAHIFGGPKPYKKEQFKELIESGEEITPGMVLDIPMQPADDEKALENVQKRLEFYQTERGRFCYMQTPGIFEFHNAVFGMENHMIQMILEPDLMKEVYGRQAEWNRRYAESIIEIGMDMIHISDDYGAQNDLLFSKDMWMDMIYPNIKITADYVKSTGTFLSIHSDGNINRVLPELSDLGFDILHPWQESAGMSYDTYLSKYSDDFGIMGGLCVQSTLGFGDYDNLRSEIERVFSLLKGRRWLFCTTHFVQDHCSIDELVYAYDLVVKLARD
jgi:uroporphyrinogen decarboxylase